MNLQKPTYVANPKTKRLVLVGGKTWLKLVKTGVLDRGDYLPPSCALRVAEHEFENDIEKLEILNAKKQELLDAGIPKDHTVRIYPKKNQVLIHKPNSNAKDTIARTADSALDIIDQIQNGEIDMSAFSTGTQLSRDEAREYLQGLIFAQMVKKKIKFKSAARSSHTRVAGVPQRQPDINNYMKKKKKPLKPKKNVIRKPKLTRQSRQTTYKNTQPKPQPVYVEDAHEYASQTETETETDAYGYTSQEDVEDAYASETTEYEYIEVSDSEYE